MRGASCIGSTLQLHTDGVLVVSLAERQAEIERAQREAELAQRRAERMSIAEIDQQMDQFSQLVDTVMAAELLTLGYHQHKRQWRRRR